MLFPPKLGGIRGCAVICAGWMAGLSAAMAQRVPEIPTPASAATAPGAAVTANPSSTTSTTPATSPAPATPPAEEVVSLSPFEVISDTKGYYSANTISGTRFSTKLEDLPSSVTIITKEQMMDFAILDINDLFLYSANTEGTGTFSDFAIDRNGSVQDNVSLNPTQANRVRGIAPAAVSLGNFETMGRMPIDPLGIDAIEISRGPNANIFGLGSPSGAVNLVPSTANLTRHHAHVEGRADSYGGYRTSLDVNRALVRGKVALRFSGAFQHEGFVRKPSGVNTVRYAGMVKLQPFRQTTLSGSFGYYRMHGNRPNYTTPRDGISYWLASGMPSWDPVAQTVRLGDRVSGPYPSDAAVPDYFTRSFTGNNRSQVFVDGGRVAYWSTPATTSSLTPQVGTGTIRFMAPSPAAGVSLGRFDDQPLFVTTPAVAGTRLYDWSSINLAAINRSSDETITSNIQLDQILFNSPLHTLALQAAWLREDSERYQRHLFGILNSNGQSGQLLVDVNERLLDGSINPYFGRPYIGQDQPITSRQPALWDTYRAQLGYRLDLTRQKGWLSHLGLHQLGLYDEYKDRVSRRYSYKDANADAHAWIAPGTPRGNQGAIPGGPSAAPQATRGYFRYYVGDATGANVDYAPGDFAYGSADFVYGNPTTGFVSEPSQLRQVAVTDASGGGFNTRTVIKTVGAMLQSHLFNERFVSTVGLREDRVYTKFGATPQLAGDGIGFDHAAMDSWAAGDYHFNSGRTMTAGAAARPLRDLGFAARLERHGGMRRVLGSTLRGLSLTYNYSDSFAPSVPAQDIFRRGLPNPTAEGHDYGIGLNLLEGRLIVRLNRYKNTQRNARDGDASAIAQRLLRLDVASSDPFQLEDRATTWVTAMNPSFTPQQVRDEVARQIGLSQATQDALVNAAATLAATHDTTAEGTELEININPTRYWTLSASATETRAIDTNISSSIQQWIDQRLPVWTTLVDPTLTPTADNPGRLWWLHNYGGSQSAAQNFASQVQSPYLVIQQQQGKATPQIRRYNFRLSTNYRLAGAFSDHRWLKNVFIGGAVRWEDRAAIGYYGVQQFPATITALDPNRPIYDQPRAYLDAFLGYQTRLFSDKIGARFQLNVRNLQENGRLQPIGALPNGAIHSYRIVDPRQFIFQVSFDL